jgi:hypothetical protein
MEIHQICSALGELAVPGAFLDRTLDKFLAWNSRFLIALRISEEEIRVADASKILPIQGEETEISGGLRMIPCSSVLMMPGQLQVGGHVITTRGTLSLVMLDIGSPNGTLFQTGRRQGIQEEQSRVNRFLYDKVSPLLMAVAFLAEDLVKELKAIEPGTEQKMLRMRTLLASAFDEMHLLFGPNSVPADLG